MRRAAYIICSHLPVLVSATHCGIKISTNLQEPELPIITKALWLRVEQLSEQCVILNLIKKLCIIVMYCFLCLNMLLFIILTFILVTVIFIFSFRAAISNKFELS